MRPPGASAIWLVLVLGCGAHPARLERAAATADPETRPASVSTTVRATPMSESDDDTSPLESSDRALLGLDEGEVLSRMGEPSERRGAEWIYRHPPVCPSDQRIVTIHFRDSRATAVRGERLPAAASCPESAPLAGPPQ